MTASYDPIANSYDRPANLAFYGGIAEMLSKALATRLEPGLSGQALDLACGSGVSTGKFLATLPGAEWTGCDVSTEMLALARKKQTLREVRWVLSSAERLPFADASFSAVACCLGAHWFEASASDEIRRVLKPGGVFGAAVPLLGISSQEDGNRALSRASFALRRIGAGREKPFQLRRSTSQGFRQEAILGLWADWNGRLHRPGYIEEFRSRLDFVAALKTRGCLMAILGCAPGSPEESQFEQILAIPDAPVTSDPEKNRPGLRFEWPIGILIAQKPL